MSTQIPSIGRSGIVNSVRKLAGTFNPGYRAVDSGADFIAGQVAVLGADADGNAVLTVAGATSTGIIGLFFCHKTTSFYRPIVDETQTFGTSPNSSTVAYLNHSNLKGTGGTYVVVKNVANVAQGYGIDYTVSYTNGTITRLGGGAISASATVYVSYVYADPNLSGIDQTMDSNCAATLEGEGEVATLVYDAKQTYTLMGLLYSNANGYITSASGGGTTIGKVTKVPTASDPELHFWFRVGIV